VAQCGDVVAQLGDVLAQWVRYRVFCGSVGTYMLWLSGYRYMLVVAQWGMTLWGTQWLRGGRCGLSEVDVAPWGCVG
jgi:hypothetical protein